MSFALLHIPYFIVTHACTLHRLGILAHALKQLIERPPPAAIDVERVRERLTNVPHPIETWPEEDPVFEENLITCCAVMFLGLPGSERCAADLRDILESERYGYLTALLANIKAYAFVGGSTSGNLSRGPPGRSRTSGGNRPERTAPERDIP